MRFIFSTGSLFTYGTDRCVELAARAGFDGVEVLVDFRWDTRQAAYLARLRDRHQMPIVAIHSPFLAEVPGWPDDEPGRLRASVALAEELGASVVVHHLPQRMGRAFVHAGRARLMLPIPGWNVQADLQRWLMNGYRALQDSTAVTLCIENMPARRWLGRTLNLFHWNRMEDMPRFASITMDTTHLGTWGLEPADVYQRWRDAVRHVHLSNFDGREHRRPEQGRLQLSRLLASLASDGYAGAVCLELSPDALDAGESDERIVTLLSESLDRCRGWARAGRALGSTEAAP